MALTIAEEQFLKDQKAIYELEKQIETKQAELSNGLDTRNQDIIDFKALKETEIQGIQTQIDAIKTK